LKKLLLSEIWIYPIKSLGGIRLKSSEVKEKGLELDRRWMLVDERGNFLTQRVFSSMALFKLTMIDDFLEVSFKGNQISIPKSSALNGSPIQSKIWDDSVITYEVNPTISDWFSSMLGMNCRLVSFPEEGSRPVDAAYKINDENVSLADGYPFLIIGQASLDDLNHRLKKPLPINRFRPNFVFTGGEPYQEDSWRNFKIGKNKFIGVKPCARCVLTTVDQETAEKGTEPLATLASYRKRENKIYFGQNVVAVDHYEIYEGDEISF
jgi:uncharacterized protein YcbX